MCRKMAFVVEPVAITGGKGRIFLSFYFARISNWQQSCQDNAVVDLYESAKLEIHFQEFSSVHKSNVLWGTGGILGDIWKVNMNYYF